MPLRTSRPQPSVLRIDAVWPVAARLFGLPFLALGVWFLVQLGQGIWDALVGGPNAAPVTAAGFVVGVVVMAMFLVPGVLLTLARKWVEVDGTLRELRETTHVVVTARIRRRPLADAVEVVSRRREIRSTGPNGRVSVFPQLEVRFHDGTREDLPPGDTDEEVDRLGPVVALTIGVPYRNELRLEDDEAVETVEE